MASPSPEPLGLCPRSERLEERFASPLSCLANQGERLRMEPLVCDALPVGQVALDQEHFADRRASSPAYDSTMPGRFILDRAGYFSALMRAAARALKWALVCTPSCAVVGRHTYVPLPAPATLMLFTEEWLAAGVLPIAVVWLVLLVRDKPSKLGFTSYVES